MLLRALYDLAHSRDLLDDPAFAAKNIRWIIKLDRDGNLTGSGPVETVGDKKQGKSYSAPRLDAAKNAGGVAEFLADGLTALFGLDAEPEKYKDNPSKRAARDQNNKRKHENFWAMVQEAFAETKHPALEALLHFHQRVDGCPPFLQWGVSAEAKADEKPCWWLTTASGQKERYRAENFTFQVEDLLLLEDEEVIRPYWRRVYRRLRDDKEDTAKRGICLITGQDDVPIAATHLPKIKLGVSTAQSTGAALVSFDKDAFTSYGFSQSYNAPVSIEATKAYCEALNWLLKQENHSIRIGDAMLCFWARPRDSEEATDIFAQLLTRPDPQAVRRFMRAPLAGIPRELEREGFYSVMLTGNGGRVVVRHWMQTTIEAARANLKRWFEDLRIVEFDPPDAGGPKRAAKRDEKTSHDDQGMPPLALFRLACTTVREAKDLQPEVPAQLYRAALEGTAPSLSLLKPIVHRLKIDLARNGPKTLWNWSRFALLRLILNRNAKGGDPMIEPEVFETDDPAYNCGRLLAIFDDLQMQAHEWKLEGAGVVERYYGSASSAPNSAFGILWRLHQHHLRKLAQQGDKGKRAAEAIKRRIAEIACHFKRAGEGLPPQFPRTFNLQEQGRFALGFYQEKARAMQARQKNRQSEQTDDAQSVQSDEGGTEVEPLNEAPR